MKCDCGQEFEGMFCPSCGKRKEDILQQQNTNQQMCSCGHPFEGNFCSYCGAVRPETSSEDSHSAQTQNNDYLPFGSVQGNTVANGNQIATMQRQRTVKDWFKSGLSKAFFLNIILSFLSFFIFEDTIGGFCCLFSVILASPFLYIKFDLFSDRNLTDKERKQLSIVIIILEVVAGWFFDAGFSAFGTLIINFWLLYLMQKNLSPKSWKITKIVLCFVILGVFIATGYQANTREQVHQTSVNTATQSKSEASEVSKASEVSEASETSTDADSDDDEILEFYLGEKIEFESGNKEITFNDIYLTNDPVLGIVLCCDITFTNTGDEAYVFNTGELGFSAYSDGIWEDTSYCDYNNMTISAGKTFDTVVEFYLPENSNTDISKIEINCGGNGIVYPYTRN